MLSLPGIGALDAAGLTAPSSASSQAGGSSTGGLFGSGISSPVMIGGFKSDGTVGGPPTWVYLIGVAALIALWVALWRK